MTAIELEDFLIKHGLEDREFADLIGVTKPALDHWFRGRRKIPATVVKIVRFLDKNPEMIPVFYGN